MRTPTQSDLDDASEYLAGLFAAILTSHPQVLVAITALIHNVGVEGTADVLAGAFRKNADEIQGQKEHAKKLLEKIQRKEKEVGLKVDSEVGRILEKLEREEKGKEE